ncbi:lipid II flippase MurJ [Dyella flagellata]|uniref:Biofilm formation protein PslL n=1 Tax=Dyella flagellata TaxID=1867833 RepID=A0ABQ5XDQ1_9GAMM|nr:lipid II flippase MurJ [Dyella flagellata]GLQ89442.1 biofilm formation protein PslL [Dyella flagellata]
MFAATFKLTLATLAGLLAGFAREWLLVADWGSGARTDAFLIAMFLPEAVRMALAGGLVGAAALPIYQQHAAAKRVAWLRGQNTHLLLLGLLLASLICLLATPLSSMIGPGLPPAARAQAAESLRVLAWCLPGIVLQALWSVPHQATARFVVAGMGSLLYNVLPVLVLLMGGRHVQEKPLCLAFVAGSLLMALALLPGLGRDGWRPWQLRIERADSVELYRRLLPLLASSGASQGLMLVERIAASLLGAGVITVVNLARKLVNLPLVALMGLNQVLLSLLGRHDQNQRRLGLLRRGLAVSTLLTLPAAVTLIGAAPTLVAWLLPHNLAVGPLPGLLAWFAGVTVFGSWNAMLARYGYAQGDTRTPMHCELSGSALNALALLLLPHWLGLPGIALSALLGVLLTGWLLLWRLDLLSQINLLRQWLACAVLLVTTALLLFPLHGMPWLQLELAGLMALLTISGTACWLRPGSLAASERQR